MRVRFRGFEYLYDTERDKCVVSSPEGTAEYENPYEGFSAFIGRVEASMRSQLADEITVNGRDRWLGVKKE